MPPSSLLSQIFARDPRKLVRLPEVSVDAALAELQALQEKLTALPAAPVETAPSTPGVPETLNASLCALATHVWRTRGKLIDPATGEPKEETKRIYRHVEGAMEAFAQMSVTLNDWIDQPYDPGLPVKVLTFQPTPGLERDTVVEAVKPTVIWRDQLLQLGEVVVGIPATSGAPQ